MYEPKKQELSQECKTYMMWHQNLSAAYWLLFILGMLLVLLTDRWLTIAGVISMGFLIFCIDILVEVNHARWHAEKRKKGE